MKANRTKMLGTMALVAVLCMQLFWIYNSFQMSVHQMGYDNPWSLAADVRAHAFFSALYQSRITLLTSLLTMVVIILSLIDQINYIDEQERVRLLREDFSYAMVHDMKSPLTSIIMGTKYLHNGVLEKKPEIKEKYFCIVEDEAQHLLALINRLLTISKLEHGKLSIQKAEIDLEAMIEDVVDKYKAKSAKPIHITTLFGATSVLADEEYLKEAISNIVDNATKYSKEEINIQISTSENDRNVYIKIYDEGIGIARSEMKTIFNRFERAAEHERDARKTRGGFGIGLNYVLQVNQCPWRQSKRKERKRQMVGVHHIAAEIISLHSHINNKAPDASCTESFVLSHFTIEETGFLTPFIPTRNALAAPNLRNISKRIGI